MPSLGWQWLPLASTRKAYFLIGSTHPLKVKQLGHIQKVSVVGGVVDELHLEDEDAEGAGSERL